MNGGNTAHEFDPILEEWVAKPNDLIGGWSVTPDDGKRLSEGSVEIACFTSGEVAEHIVQLHNAWLRLGQLRAQVEVRGGD